jgi:hypothetical protein
MDDVMTSLLRSFNDTVLAHLDDLVLSSHFVIEAAKQRSHFIINL